MGHAANLLALVAIMFTSSVVANETNVERLQNTGVRVRFESAGNNDVSRKPLGLTIPRDWQWTEQSILLVRELISALDPPPTIYVCCDPRVSGHEKKVDELNQGFDNLPIKLIGGTYIGIVGQRDSVNSPPCRVLRVVPGTPAEAAGIRKGDTILAINGTPVTDFRMAQKVIHDFLPDETIEIHVNRDSKELKLKVTVGGIPLSSFARGEPSDATKDRASRFDNGNSIPDPR